MRLRKAIKIIIVLKSAFKSFRGNDPLRMSAATAFFAFFALPAIIIILSKVLGILFNNSNKIISGRLFHQLSQVFGNSSANQIEDISENLQEINLSPFFTLFGVLFLILSSTTLFAVIKNSLNQLWNIKEKPTRNFKRILKERAVGLSIILFSGFLFIVSLLSDLLLVQLQSQLTVLTNKYSLLIIKLANNVVSVLIITPWFAILFKYLPDIRIRWKAVFIGAFVTTLLYKVGEFILERLLMNGNVGLIFGASASIVLILLFVFYSSLIFYFGAAFTKNYAQFYGMDLEPTSNAVAYQITEVEPD